jgi:pimeloyl-ACP methyl ester carboxylesterase
MLMQVYCIDLLGYGWSDKPVTVEPVVLYNMNTWAQQLNDFIDDVVQSPVFFGGNSIGGIVALQAAVKRLDLARGAFLLDLSVRGLHVKNQTPLQRPFVSAFQWTLWNSPIGDFFFKSVAQPNTVANVLKEAYYNSSHVTDELVEALLQPGLLPNASRVFLDFLCYSGGPLPGELLEEVSCPVSMVWGVDDPWEEISKGRGFKRFPNVEEFIEIAQCGHCPQDEQPETVNDYLIHFIERHAGNQKPVAA